MRLSSSFVSSFWLFSGFGHAALTATNLVTSPPVATGVVEYKAIPVTAVGTTPLINTETVAALVASFGNSTWSIEVDVYSQASKYESFLSLSWPDGDGPGPSVPQSRQTWDVCAMYIPALFNKLDSAGTKGNGSCFDVIGSTCHNAIFNAVFALRENVTTICQNVVNVPLPKSCSTIYGNTTATNLTLLPIFNPTSGSVLANNSSTSLQVAMQKTWPLLIIESSRNRSLDVGFLRCPQASNGTSTGAATPSGTATSSGTVTPTGTGSAGAATSSAAAASLNAFGGRVGWLMPAGTLIGGMFIIL